MADETTPAGMRIPFGIGPTGGIEWTSGADKVRQNVGIILSVRLGERPLQRDFGTRIPSLAHEPNDEVLGALVESQAREALMRWEPRLLVTRARTEHDDGELRVWLDYVQLDRQASGRIAVSPNA